MKHIHQVAYCTFGTQLGRVVLGIKFIFNHILGREHVINWLHSWCNFCIWLWNKKSVDLCFLKPVSFMEYFCKSSLLTDSIFRVVSHLTNAVSFFVSILAILAQCCKWVPWFDTTTSSPTHKHLEVNSPSECFKSLILAPQPKVTNRIDHIMSDKQLTSLFVKSSSPIKLYIWAKLTLH